MKMSNTYYKLIAVALFGLITAIFAATQEMPVICAFCSAATFVCWYGAVMLPPYQKYRAGYKKNKGSIEL
jgi:hypothetical protein